MCIIPTIFIYVCIILRLWEEREPRDYEFYIRNEVSTILNICQRVNGTLVVLRETETYVYISDGMQIVHGAETLTKYFATQVNNLPSLSSHPSVASSVANLYSE